MTEISEAAMTAFEEMKQYECYQYVIFKLSGDFSTILLDEIASPDKTYDDFTSVLRPSDELMEASGTGECRLAMVKISVDTSPENSPVASSSSVSANSSLGNSSTASSSSGNASANNNIDNESVIACILWLPFRCEIPEKMRYISAKEYLHTEMQWTGRTVYCERRKDLDIAKIQREMRFDFDV
ncbi:actin-depolymerizing factor 10 [Aplysia californica]|uniref:Actin-depolymerizing factor 10 n=1 Tax=Aplysia californica TaxID=6500 RepID=A0ABM0K801_APLCA|nr:actin-depolymerizing factor 10 [Aplysia californica]